ncbi:SUKH-3 domain-containing protein [Streptomyces sp. NPDC059534]|uniref:SUKH-3 domain-containing protein n=1 Tax=Streptomyces sp. NPDC059534 TaxID=3346859 RepID=UPI003691F9C4
MASDVRDGHAGACDTDAPLTAAGWRPGRDAGVAALQAVLTTVAVGQGTLFPAAERALREFHGLRIAPAPHGGREVAATGCVVDPREARFASPQLDRLAADLGVRLFPLGRTEADAPLAVDEEGRLLMLGPGGPWLLGTTPHDGLTALADGRVRARLRPPRWRFPLPGLSDGDGDGEGAGLGAAVRAAIVAVYVLHTTGVYSTRALRLRATTLRGVGVVALDEEFPLGPGPLESSADPLTAAMTERLTATGVRAGSCALVLTLPVPPTVTGPRSTVGCAITAGGPAHEATLTLSAGMSASLGPAAETLNACARAFAEWSGAPV